MAITANPKVGTQATNLLQFVKDNDIQTNKQATDWQQSRILGRLLKANKIFKNVPNVPVNLVDIRLCLTNAAKMAVGLSYKGEPDELEGFEIDTNLFNEKGEFVGTSDELANIDYSTGFYWKNMVTVQGSKPFATIDSINFDESNVAIVTVIDGEPYESKGKKYPTFEMV
jgi:hypothetical protein